MRERSQLLTDRKHRHTWLFQFYHFKIQPGAINRRKLSDHLSFSFFFFILNSSAMQLEISICCAHTKPAYPLEFMLRFFFTCSHQPVCPFFVENNSQRIIIISLSNRIKRKILIMRIIYGSKSLHESFVCCSSLLRSSKLKFKEIALEWRHKLRYMQISRYSRRAVIRNQRGARRTDTKKVVWPDRASWDVDAHAVCTQSHVATLSFIHHSIHIMISKWDFFIFQLTLFDQFSSLLCVYDLWGLNII